MFTSLSQVNFTVVASLIYVSQLQQHVVDKSAEFANTIWNTSWKTKCISHKNGCTREINAIFFVTVKNWPKRGSVSFVNWPEKHSHTKPRPASFITLQSHPKTRPLFICLSA